jgi:hypothetical protein
VYLALKSLAVVNLAALAYLHSNAVAVRGSPRGSHFSSTATHTTPSNGTAQPGYRTDNAMLYVNVASLLACSSERLMLHLWSTRTRLSHENTRTQATAASYEEEILLQCLRKRRN